MKRRKFLNNFCGIGALSGVILATNKNIHTGLENDGAKRPCCRCGKDLDRLECEIEKDTHNSTHTAIQLYFSQKNREGKDLEYMKRQLGKYRNEKEITLELCYECWINLFTGNK